MFPPGRAIARHAARAVTCLATLLLAACVTRGPLIPPSLPDSHAPSSVELAETPFFPQTEYQCGPAALATILVASGVKTTPDELAPRVYLPARHGSLQVEMQATPRKLARLTYLPGPNLDDILAEVNAGRPVLVLHDYGVPFWPRWHYAVVIGYDARADEIVLRSGATRRQVLSAKNFMRAWDNGKRWAMVTLRPGETPASATAARYLESAADFERGAPPEQARLAFDAAVKRWPTEPIAWIGRGTAEYRSGHLAAAAQDYAAALKLDGAQVGARNNLAMTLLELGCPRRAKTELDHIDPATLPTALKTAVADTRQHIDTALSGLRENSEPVACRATMD